MVPKILIFFVLAIPFFSSCQDNNDEQNGSVPSKSTDSFQVNYILKMDSINKARITLFNKFKGARSSQEKKSILEETKNLFIKSITQDVFKAWYNTEYDFHGNSLLPRNGTIACGYFVTSALSNLNFKLDRFALSETYSEKMIKTLCNARYIHRTSGQSISDFEKSIIKYGKGIYIVGLDMHTGFIYNDGKTILFIHANYGLWVMPQILTDGTGLRYSNYRVIGKISDDEQFLKKWLKEENFSSLL